jgi:hypothetical protein
VRLRALCAGLALAAASPSVARADGCTPARVDVADWPIVRSARVPGFTLRLPRSYVRSTDTTSAPGATATWADGARARFTLVHRATAATVPPADAAGGATRCDERIGSATATIVSSAAGASAAAFAVHAHLRWPDGEEVDVHGIAADRSQLDQLLAAVRTVRRTGA